MGQMGRISNKIMSMNDYDAHADDDYDVYDDCDDDYVNFEDNSIQYIPPTMRL